jgi:hypothetical protein
VGKAIDGAPAKRWAPWTDSVCYSLVPGINPIIVPSRHRKFGELSGDEQREVRDRYERGDKLSAISSKLGVFAGSVMEAADGGQWPRGGEPTKGMKILALKAARPSMGLSAIARKVKCGEAYVSLVINNAKAGAP